MMEIEDEDDRRKRIRCNHNRGYRAECKNGEFELYFNHTKGIVVAKCTECGMELAVTPNMGVHVTRDNMKKCPKCGHYHAKRRRSHAREIKGPFKCPECGHRWGTVYEDGVEEKYKFNCGTCGYENKIFGVKEEFKHQTYECEGCGTILQLKNYDGEFELVEDE